MTRQEQRQRHAQIWAMQCAGATDADVVAAFGVSRYTAQSVRYMNGKRNPRGRKKSPAIEARNAAIRDCFVAGETLQQIGDAHGLTRERVRQILEGDFGLTGDQGGAVIRRFLTAPRRVRSATDERYVRSLRCTRQRYLELTGNRYRSVDLHALRFARQAINARRRGIPFELTFEQWWSLWQQSGHYADRSRGGYIMGRIGDTGPYAVNNVYICTAAQNAHDQYFSEKPRKKAIKIHAQPRVLGDVFVPTQALWPEVADKVAA